MQEASVIALISGFGGVVLGGIITYFSERNFRRQERKSIDRKNFTLCLCELERIVNNLTSAYKTSTKLFPNETPLLLASEMRSFASLSSIPSRFEVEKLFSVNHKEDELYSDISHLLRQYNATLSALETLNAMKIELHSKWVSDGVFAPTGEEDIANVRFDLSDPKVVTELTILENLHRDFFRDLVGNIKSGISIMERINKNSERKFKGIIKKEFPKIELVKDFVPLDYLADMPRFSITDLIQPSD